PSLVWIGLRPAISENGAFGPIFGRLLRHEVLSWLSSIYPFASGPHQILAILFIHEPMGFLK
ncbi:MAG TPA: hypothetical protein PLI59_12635, partial [Candidatus Obscuribacter sp.]|nr:hypothetical protein [Candidatus Obscuribacter sp.]